MKKQELFIDAINPEEKTNDSSQINDFFHFNNIEPDNTLGADEIGGREGDVAKLYQLDDCVCIIIDTYDDTEVFFADDMIEAAKVATDELYNFSVKTN